MARVQNTLIGRASGSVDEVTFLTIFRQNVIRAKMAHQTNPNSTAQQAQRFKYNTLLELYENGKDVIDIGFKKYSPNRTPWNSFMAYNSKAMFTNNGTSVPDMDITKLQTGRGYLIPRSRIFGELFQGQDVGWLAFPDAFNLKYMSGSTAGVLIINATQGVISSNIVTPDFNGAVYLQTKTINLTGDIIYVSMFYFTDIDGALHDSWFRQINVN